MPELMDRALKERIIGAIVLVVFAVLVVPVFLDGPSRQDGQVAESITLPGQNGTATRTQRIVLNRDRSEPEPASTAPPREESPPPQQQQAETAAATAATATEILPRVTPEVEAANGEAAGSVEVSPQTQAAPVREEARASAIAAVPDTASATGMWAVQLGSFGNKQNADRLAANLRKSGYAAFLSKLDSAGKPLHRVRVGPQKSRADAEAVAAQLAGAGHKGQVVPHP